ncbi:hypothetical protein JBE04_44565, partial [Streptomyces sp. PRKS01-29]
MSPALAFALHVAALLLIGWAATWAIRRRHRRAKARARLQRHMHLRRHHDTQPAPIDDTCLQLEALYRAPAAERRT